MRVWGGSCRRVRRYSALRWSVAQSFWKQETGESLEAVLYGEGDRLQQARHAQPALFALEYGLSELWRSWGIEPSVVLGHSLGEYVAAVVAGIFSLEDGLRLVHARAELMDSLAGRGVKPGAMHAVSASLEHVEQALEGLEQEAGIAAINGPSAVVISGAAEAIAEASRRLQREGIRTRALEVTHAFHSPLLEPILAEFERRAERITYREPRLRVVSNVTGRVAAAGEMSHAGYWRRHMRSTVLFHAGLQAALATGCSTLLEIGPQPHLRALAARHNPELEHSIRVSMRRNASDFTQLCQTLAQLYVEGHSIDWSGFDKGYQRSRVALPTYPFERQRYWHGIDSEEAAHNIWQRASERALSQSRLTPVGLRLNSFPARWESLRKLTIAVVCSTLKECGTFTTPGLVDPNSLIARSGIVPAQAKLVRRWLQMLCGEGYLKEADSGFVIPAVSPQIDLAVAWKDAEAALEDDPFLLAYLRNCVKYLKNVLTGKTSPLETLFPSGSPELAKNLYEKSTGTSYANAIVAAAAQAACIANSSRNRLRILEIGGGTGATTAAVLPAFPAEGISYHFTDVSESFLQKASTRFSAYRFVRYGILDIESDDDVDAHLHSYDLVIAANVVHATRDLGVTLQRVKRLLAPGGTAILLEATQNLAWHEITTALIEGWQKSEDDLRGGLPLISPVEWIAAFEKAGFESAIQAPESGSPAESIGLHVLLAKAPGGELTARHPAERIPCNSACGRSRAGEAKMLVPLPAAMDLLSGIPPAERHEFVLQIVMEEIAHVLRLGPDATGKKRSRLMDLGLDSLMAVELRNRLTTRLGVADLPATLIFDYPTADAIAGYALGRIQQTEEAQAEADTSRVLITPERLFTATEIDNLSDETVAELLRSRLAQ